MNVDLPAPLSPSTQVTWPSRTETETSFSAITLPKYFETSRVSSSVVLSFTFGLLPRCAGRSC